MSKIKLVVDANDAPRYGIWHRWTSDEWTEETTQEQKEKDVRYVDAMYAVKSYNRENNTNLYMSSFEFEWKNYEQE